MVDQKECLYIAHGTLTNNGTISMTARGAKAVRQNVYLLKKLMIVLNMYLLWVQQV